MRRFCLWLLVISLLLCLLPAVAQEVTPEATADPEVTVDPEATSEGEPTAEVEPTQFRPTLVPSPTPEPEATADVEATESAEATDEPSGENRAEFPGPGSYNVREVFGEQERAFVIDIPQSYTDDGDPMPLVFVLHGANGTGPGMRSFSGFVELGETEGFISVHPSGIIGAWNDGRPDPGLADINDIAYFDHLIDLLSNSLNIDESRVYTTGYSMGGMMSFRLGCNLPHRFAAIGSVASTMPLYFSDECEDSAPVPVIVIQGTDDNVVPWMGMRGGYLSAADTMAYWSEHNGCTYEPGFVLEPDADPEDGTLVIREQYDDCDAEVMLYGVYQGGHTWPGRAINVPFELGVTSQDISAAEVMWEFFQRHALDDVE